MIAENFVSTRGQAPAVTAKTAIVQGLAADGGLFVPAQLPTNQFSPDQFVGQSYQDIARTILGTVFPDFTEAELAAAVTGAYGPKWDTDEITPLTALGQQHLLELYHGPTSAFKDVALTILPHLLKTAYASSGSQKTVYILTATSGDTGKAALEGFKDVPDTFVTVFYPSEGVSAVQQRQMQTTTGNNVEVVGLQGNFDDCQRLVKDCYEDAELIGAFPGVQFSSANSINVGRLFPQVVYYFKAYADLVVREVVRAGEAVNFAVPTGNFGNILAGYFAKQLGCPIGQLICASNQNNVLTEFLRTGRYDANRPFYTTMSPSMDILVSSNLERLLYLASDGDAELVAGLMKQLAEDGTYQISPELLAKLQETFVAYDCSEAQCADAIKQAWEEHGRLIDPHTAVGWHAALAHEAEGGRAAQEAQTGKGVRSANVTQGDETRDAQAAPQARPATPPTVVLSTASPYKFAADVLAAIAPAGEPANTEIPAADLPAAQAFAALSALEKLTGEAIPPNLAETEKLPILHQRQLPKDAGRQVVTERLEVLNAAH
ncbi:hypothetical protein BK816_00670 [Boudabousia tangfeifanii]|uniref:Threonine synthase n=1 Tax=Boudabousia tangfeifanii TaxID=1912795 RepID=A0A1D9MIG6_9ACTO|nr:threonine synthase [Boudabousia tangfeifanii]AOZ71989.1 hypothetical protein BK816_00670 [Boudabousia tangfeifanii]